MEQQNEVYAYIGSRLRHFRERAGLRQREVAEMLFVSPAQYQKYESGANKCPVDTILALCRRYGVPLEAVMPIEAEKLETTEWAESDTVSDQAGADVPRLLKAFETISDPKQRLRLISLIESMGT